MGASLLGAADLSTYRGFRFGMDFSLATKQAGARPAESRTVQQRPAVIQELDWRPEAASDSVKEAVLSFYNGELSQIVVIYDRFKVAGMSVGDMVEAFSSVYGPSTAPSGDIAFHSNYGETAQVLARWEDGDYAYNLVRTGDRASFAMVLTSKRLSALADASLVNAARLDAAEAPQRAIDLKKKQDAEEHLALEKPEPSISPISGLKAR
jgi:hypothetical protein